MPFSDRGFTNSFIRYVDANIRLFQPTREIETKEAERRMSLQGKFQEEYEELVFSRKVGFVLLLLKSKFNVSIEFIAKALAKEIDKRVYNRFRDVHDVSDMERDRYTLLNYYSIEQKSRREYFETSAKQVARDLAGQMGLEAWRRLDLYKLR